jgi:hypothetical protein
MFIAVLCKRKERGRTMPTYSKAKKLRILAKCRGRCAYCGRELALYSMTVDHIRCKSSGGNNYLKNLNPACKDCNRQKGDMSITAFRKKAAALYGEGEYKLYFSSQSPTEFIFYYMYLEAETKRLWDFLDYITATIAAENA